MQGNHAETDEGVAEEDRGGEDEEDEGNLEFLGSDCVGEGEGEVWEGGRLMLVH